MKNRIYLLSLLILVVLVDCQCFTKPVVVKSILLEVPNKSGGMANPLAHDAFALVVEEAVQKNSHYRYDAEDSEGAIIRFALMPPEEQTPEAVLMLVASLTQAGQNNEHQSFADIKVVNGIVSGPDVLSAVNKVLENLYLIQKGSSSDNQTYLDKIEAYVAGEQVEQAALINAISVLGATEEKKGLMPLIAILSKTSDIVVGNACLIALGRLRDPEAMPAIIDFVERKPPLIRRQGIMAARMIASQLAAEWLLVMAYGYEDPLVRKEAMEALLYVEEKLKLLSP